MYDPIETDISYKQLVILSEKCKKINTCIIGGWATYFYVNKEYHTAFGKDYMGSRDIDVFFILQKKKNLIRLLLEWALQKMACPLDMN